MTVEEKLNVSRINYKFTVGLLKILPMLMAGLCLLNTILSSFNIDLPIITYISGIGFVPWLFILLSSYLFRFCEYHRMFLWYILTNNIICITDMEIGLPISNWNLFIFHIIVAGVFLFLILYFHQRCRKLDTELL